MTDRHGMDIFIGRVPGAAFPDFSARGEGSGTVEGTVLAVRPPRGVRHGPEAAAKPGEERRRKRSHTRADPPGGRVLTLLVSDPAGIPADVGSASYRVILRFIREG